MKAEIIKTCQELSKLSTCRCCGGEVEHGVCKWCKTDNEQFRYLVDYLKTLLETTSIDFDIYIELLNIKNINEDFIDSLVKENLQRIKSDITKDALNGDYKSLIKLLSKKNCEVIVNPTEAFRMVAIEHFKGKLKNIDDDTYILFIKLYAQRIIESSNLKTIVGKLINVDFINNEAMEKLFKSQNAKTFGCCIVSETMDAIRFNQDEFLKNKKENPTDNISTIYHEIQHLIQRKYYTVSEYYCYTGLLIAKDDIIEEVIDSYYHENYNLLPVEANANYYACQILSGELENCGLDNSYYSKGEARYKEMCFNEYRSLNGKIKSVDEIFIEIITKPNLVNPETILKKYPIIGLEYKIADGQLVKRSKIELIEALNNEDNSEIRFIYQSLLSSMEFSESKSHK